MWVSKLRLPNDEWVQRYAAPIHLHKIQLISCSQYSLQLLLQEDLMEAAHILRNQM